MLQEEERMQLFKALEEMGVRRELATRVFQIGIFRSYSLEENLMRLRLLHAGLDDAVTLVFEQVPTFYLEPLELLEKRLEWFHRHDYSYMEARRIILMARKILSLSDEELDAAHAEICRLLPTFDHQRKFVLLKPQVYTLGSAHLKTKSIVEWNGDSDSFWTQLCTGLSRSAPIYEESPPAKSPVRPPALPLYARIVADGATVEQARLISQRLRDVFKEADEQTYQLLRAAGWNFADINNLVRLTKHRDWSKNPAQMLAAERELVKQGFPAEGVRQIVIAHDAFATEGVEPIGPAVRAFLDLGYSMQELFRMVNKVPRILYRSAEDIQQWYKEQRMLGQRPESHLRVLAFPRLKLAKGRPRQASVPPPPREITPPREESPKVVFETSSKDWRKILKRLLRVGQPDWSEEAWAAFEQSHPEYWDRTQPQGRTLEILATWLNLPENPTNTPVAQCFIRLVSEEKFQPLFALEHSPKQALQARLFRQRRYVEGNVLAHPELLLLPLEKFPEEELRYRVHVIQGHGKKPYIDPYVAFLVAATRDEFQQQIEKHLRIKR